MALPTVLTLCAPKEASAGVGEYRCPPPVQGVLHALHDRSDGGLVTTLLEMAFAGNCGISVDLNDAAAADAIEALFSEELGFVLEVPPPCGPPSLASCGLRCRLESSACARRCSRPPHSTPRL